MALRRKFKVSRQPLCSTEKVAEFRAKFGRPGVSGRKRKRQPVQENLGNQALVKKARTPVGSYANVLTLLVIMVIIISLVPNRHKLDWPGITESYYRVT